MHCNPVRSATDNAASQVYILCAGVALDSLADLTASLSSCWCQDSPRCRPPQAKIKGADTQLPAYSP
eukprot:5223459-Amphidinium_carterae.1